MASWRLYTGEEVAEAEVLLRAAHFVDAGAGYVDAVVLVLRGPKVYGQGHFASSQLLRACSPWLANLAAGADEVAAAMRARADFLEHPERICSCSHRYGDHDGHPCLPESTAESCRSCSMARTAEPVGEDPDCE